VNNTAWRESSTLRDDGRRTFDRSLDLGARLSGDRSWAGFASRDIKDVQFSSSCLLHNVLLSGIMGNMVTINDVVVPVAASKLESMSTLEAECSFPRTRLGGWVLDERKWKL